MGRSKLKAKLLKLVDELLNESHPHSEKQGGYDSASIDNDTTVHKMGLGICATDQRGHATANNASPTEIVLDASEGFIPLWRYGTTLRWWFDEIALSAFSETKQRSLKNQVRSLMRAAMLAWGDAAPIKLREERESYDFRVVVNSSPRGNVLASAFFPDSGRHDFHVYPLTFEQSSKEQIDTFTHELGHVFGLRHFFAKLREQAWPSEIFGEHDPFSIMNYGELSELTENDRSDLKELYRAVWSGVLPSVNGTPIRLFAPYHEAGTRVEPRFFESYAAKR